MDSRDDSLLMEKETNSRCSDEDEISSLSACCWSLLFRLGDHRLGVKLRDLSRHDGRPLVMPDPVHFDRRYLVSLVSLLLRSDLDHDLRGLVPLCILPIDIPSLEVIDFSSEDP